MINLNKTALLISFFSTLTQAQEITDKGYRLPESSVTKDFTLMSLTPEVDELSKYIVKANYKIPKDEALLIASNVLKISACFKVDPWILTGLIQKESSFKRDAVSPTNAAGLTQFTSSGFKEVNDQLGLRGRESATEVAINYFNTTIKECVDPNWIDLWTKPGVAEDHPEFYNLLKEEVKNDVPVAITYGAILLKTYVSYIDNKANKADLSLSTSEIYFQALQIYNGEDGDAKVKYAKNIFNHVKSMYPREFDFPFLAEKSE